VSDDFGGLTKGLPDLGRLLELLHDADRPFASVIATYRVWRHGERAHAAFVAHREAEQRRGGTVGTIQVARRSGGGEAEESPPETEEVFRVWLAGERFRREQDGGNYDGSYAIRDGNLWWMWDPISGARSNENDPKVRGVGNEFEIMLAPTVLLGLLRWRVIGRSVIAGRPAIKVEALPRPVGEQGTPLELHQLGSGADRYELAVDEQLGVLLNVVALREDQPFREVATLAVAFDQPIPDERFHFEAPAGEEIRGFRPFVRHLPVIEAQQLAPFTILIPERIPDSWKPHCAFFEASDRPSKPAHVWLQYRSEDGHESVSLSEMAATDSGPTYGRMTQEDRWHDVTVEGTVVHVTKPGSPSSQKQAHLERDGTFVFLHSETLSGDDLAKIAARLKPAPTASSL
jgi:hypothetical protein